jgi:hypothetical protein
MEWCRKIQSMDYLQTASLIGDQGLGLTQGSVSEGNELQGAIINDVTLVALRTRRRQQYAAHIRVDGCEGDLRQDTNRNESADKELILQLTTQNKEQQHMIDELSSAIKDFLKVQPIVMKTERNLPKISKQVDSQGKSKVTIYPSLNQKQLTA